MRPLRLLLATSLVSLSLSAGVALAAAPAATPTIAEKTAKLERHDGFLSWYWDARTGKILIEVARLNDPFLFGVGLASGAGSIEASLDRGQLGDLALCQFERSGPKLLLRRLQLAHRSGTPDSARTRVVAESFATSVLAALPIVAESGGRILVDATDFLLGDGAGVARILKSSGQGEWTHKDDLSAFHLERSGAFPRNTEFEVTQTFVSNDPPAAMAALLPDGRTLSLREHTSFVKLPEPGYRPRAFDPRVGYFTTSYLDHTAPYTEPIERALITRWRLEKQDTAAVLSDPVQPLVYYLDPGMPEPERSAVREAVLWWNHAFEEAGFRDALVLRDLPPGASFLDVRYSGIQWTNRAERAWSIGQSQIDPRTGEILHAVVLLDSHRRRTTSRLWQDLAPPGARGCDAGDAPDLAPLVATHADAPEASEQSLVLARLRYLAAHEVGHTLGLEHNMAATTFGWGSVMDYLGPHLEVRGDGLDLSDAYPTDIGSYDRFAIRWGYTPGMDRADLSFMVRGALASGVVYPHASDARWNEYDWGPDAAHWLETTRAVRRVMLRRFGAAQLKPGEAYYELEKRFSLCWLYHRFAIAAAQHLIGGELVTNAVAGDGQTPHVPIPAARQRTALDQVLACLDPGELDVPDAIAAALVPPPNGTERSREQIVSETGDAFSPLAAARVLAQLAIQPLCEPERAAQLSLASGDALTLDETLRRLVAATWGAVPERDPRRGRLQHITQRVTLEAIERLAASDQATPEARATAYAALENLARTLREPAKGDAETLAHRALAARELTEFLSGPAARKVRAPEPAPPGRPIGDAAR